MSFMSYVPVIGTILSIASGNDCCSQMISVGTENGIVNFLVGSDTLVVDNRQLRRGMRVAAFYDSSLPVPLIFPPQYRAEIVTALGRNQQIMLNFFDGRLLSADRSLQLNIAGSTDIKTANGQNFNCSPVNQTLLVFYTMTTRSIPPQTTPERIVVMC